MFKKALKEELQTDSYTSQEQDIYGKFVVRPANRYHNADASILRYNRISPDIQSNQKKLMLKTKSNYQVPGVGSYNLSSPWIKPTFHSHNSGKRSKSTLPKLKDPNDRSISFKKIIDADESHQTEDSQSKSMTLYSRKSRDNYSKLPAEHNPLNSELIWEKVKLQGNPEQLAETLKFAYHRNMIESTKKHIQSLKNKLKSKYKNYLISYY